MTVFPYFLATRTLERSEENFPILSTFRIFSLAQANWSEYVTATQSSGQLSLGTNLAHQPTKKGSAV
jgi:hypothetical protein